MRRKVMGFFLAVLCVYSILVALMFLSQRSMIYIPSAEKPSLQNASVSGLSEISVRTEDGLDLIGWYKAPSQPQAPVLVWFHGNASNIAITTWRAMPYILKGYGLLAVEYRGYAGNPGKPSEDGFYQDGRAFLAWLNAAGVPDARIVLYGESIGGGVAVQMAIEHTELRALILESPFTSLADAASYHYPYVPVRWLLHDHFENIAKIQSVRAPLILAYGDQDMIVPPHLGQKLYDAAGEPKSLIVIEGGGHNNLDDFNLADKIMAFLPE